MLCSTSNQILAPTRPWYSTDSNPEQLSAGLTKKCSGHDCHTVFRNVTYGIVKTETSTNATRDCVQTAKAPKSSLPAEMMQGGKDWPGQEDRQEFYLPVHGFVWFYPDELKIIDHPAFQRLAGMHQLGLAHLIYRGATHRRFEHVLGTVAVVQRMVDAVNHNSRKRHRNPPDAKDTWVLGRPLTPTEE